MAAKTYSLQESGSSSSYSGSKLTTGSILNSITDWAVLTGAGLITDAQRQLFTRYDRTSIENKLDLMRNDGNTYVVTFLQVLSNMSTPKVVQYLLALIDEILTADPSLTQLFIVPHRVYPELPLAPFFVHMSDSDFYISSTATKLLSKFMVAADWEIESSSVSRVVKWFHDTIHQSLPLDQLLPALSALQEFLRGDQHRQSFVEQDGLNFLSSILRDHLPDHQVLYQGLYCVWLLSYTPKIGAEEFPRSTIIETIIIVLRTVGTEKVIRVAVATIRNLLDKGQNNDLILQQGFAKLLNSFLARRWGDDEVAADLAVIEKSLQKNIAKLSSFDSYQAEVTSGDLSWSPCHKSDRFWRENVGRFEDNKCRVLGILVQIVHSATDPLCLSVALHDLGEFARFHPRGRAIINTFPTLKPKIMELLEHSDSGVKSQALLCCQKIMVHNWEFIPN